MKVLFSSADMARLGYAVSRAVGDAFWDTTRSEPQLVANLVWGLPRYINTIGLSGSTKVKAGGVFVHAQPFVACTSFPEPKPASVEIGDLLLLRTLVVNKKVEERHALLLQAKKTRIPATPDNANQWHLYEGWPQFIYSGRSGGLKGKKRHIKEADMYDAAKYLLIDGSAHPAHAMCCWDWAFPWLVHRPQVCSHYTAQPTKPTLSRYRCFAGEILAHLTGNAGKLFHDPAAGSDGWDQVIRDLIDETAKATSVFMGGAAGMPGSKSSRGTGQMFLTSTPPSEYFAVAIAGGEGDSDGPPEVQNEWGEDGHRGAISVVEFIVEQEQ